MEPFDYDIFEQEFRFKYRGKPWVLRTPSEMANLKYETVQFDGATVEGTKVNPVYARVLEAESVLVSESVFGEDGKTPTLDEVRGWPQPMVKDLATRAREFQKYRGADAKN